jgi:hypothetical protein
MAENEPDIKRENLADTDETPFGDTDEHAGEQDTDKGETYHDPEAKGDAETQPPPGGEDGAEEAGYGEGEGAERVPIPDSERLANRDDR